MRTQIRTWFLFSVILIGVALAVLLYKIIWLGYPLSIAGEPRTWRVEEVINITGHGGRVVVDAPLPNSSGYQDLLSEEVRSGLLRFRIDENPDGRRGHWSGKVEASTTVSYQATVTTYPYGHILPQSDTKSTYNDRVLAFLEASASVQAGDPAIVELSRELALNPADKVKLAREIYAFVSREIGSLRNGGTMDAVSVVREGRGGSLGRSRLFCALARVNKLPCRVVSGLVLTSARVANRHYWNEAYVAGKWVPFDTAKRLAEVLPSDRLVLSVSDDPRIESSGTRSVSSRFYVESEAEPYTEIVRRRVMASHAWVDQISPLLLPLHLQNNLRLLLLVPLGALAIAVLRNVVGISTFGTFMPMLIALAMTTTGLLVGTSVLIIIIAFALLSRLWIQRFYLLMVPRVAFILTFVVLLMVLIMVVADRLKLDLPGIGAFPFVIMTMIVERLSVSLEEEGVRNTIQRLGSTLFAIYATYAVIQAHALQVVFLVYPELLVAILGLHVLVGRYTGYRLMELIRFRDLLAAAPNGPSMDRHGIKP